MNRLFGLMFIYFALNTTFWPMLCFGLSRCLNFSVKLLSLSSFDDLMWEISAFFLFKFIRWEFIVNIYFSQLHYYSRNINLILYVFGFVIYWHINICGLFKAKYILVEVQVYCFCFLVSWHINLRGLYNAQFILIEEEWYYFCFLVKLCIGISTLVGYLKPNTSL